MLLLAVTARLRSGFATRRGAEAWQQQAPLVRFLRNVCNLSINPASGAQLAGRLTLLALVVVVSHSLGAGAAYFVKAAPLSALFLFSALIFGIATGWWRKE